MNGFVQRGEHRRVPRPQVTARLRTPMIWRITALEQSIATTTSTTVVKYRWQRPLVLVYMQILCQPYSDLNVAGLELAWEDGHGDQVAVSGLASLTACGRGIMGERDVIGSRWSPIEFRVKHQHIWTLKFTNNGANTITPILLFQGVEQG